MWCPLYYLKRFYYFKNQMLLSFISYILFRCYFRFILITFFYLYIWIFLELSTSQYSNVNVQFVHFQLLRFECDGTFSSVAIRSLSFLNFNWSLFSIKKFKKKNFLSCLHIFSKTKQAPMKNYFLFKQRGERRKALPKVKLEFIKR